MALGKHWFVMTCTLMVSQMEMLLTAVYVSPEKTPMAGEDPPQCANLHTLSGLI